MSGITEWDLEHKEQGPFGSSAIPTKGQIGEWEMTIKIKMASAHPSVPSVLINLSSLSYKAGETGLVTFSFSTVPVGFTLADITAPNGSLSAFGVTGNPLIYTAVFTPTAGIDDVTNVISVGTGWQNSFGIFPSSIAVSANYEVHTIRPTCAITCAQTSPTDISPLNFTFTLSKDSVDFGAGSIVVINGLVSAIAGAGSAYTADLIPSGFGIMQVSVPDGAFHDADGNSNVASASVDIQSLNGLIAYWKMDEVSDGSAPVTRVDEFDANHLTDLKASGAVYVEGAAGLINNTAQTNGQGFFAKADPSSLEFGDANFSFSFWLYVPSGVVAGYPEVFGKDGAGTDRNYSAYIELSTNKLFWQVFLSGVSYKVVNVVIARDVWQKVLCYHDADNNLVGISLNAGTRVTNLTTGALQPDGTAPFRVFRATPAGTILPNGSRIDEFAVFHRVLSTVEDSTLYNGGAGLEYPFNIAGAGILSSLPTEPQPPVAVPLSTLAAQLAVASPGDTITLASGIYGLDSGFSYDLIVPDGVTLKAAVGARPIITRISGYAPRVRVGTNSVLDGLWIGGARSEDDSVPALCHVPQDGLVQNCTFFGFYELFGSGMYRTTLQNNRIVNCGTGTLYHPIYYSNPSALPGEGLNVIDNIFVGNNGYCIHCYNTTTNPHSLVATGNFMGGVLGAMAVKGDGHVIDKNLVWTSSGIAILRLAGSFSITKTFVGQATGSVTDGLVPGQTLDNNTFVDRATAGTNPVSWNNANVFAVFNANLTEINLIVSAIQRTFWQNVNDLAIDADIEGYFSQIQNLISIWKTL